MYKATGSQAYAEIGLESGVMSASPHQLIVMLFDGAHSALVRARLHMQAGQTQLKGQSITKAINIIDNGLKAGLNLEKAESLQKIYQRCMTIWLNACYMLIFIMMKLQSNMSRTC